MRSLENDRRDLVHRWKGPDNDDQFFDNLSLALCIIHFFPIYLPPSFWCWNFSDYRGLSIKGSTFETGPLSKAASAWKQPKPLFRGEGNLSLNHLMHTDTRHIKEMHQRS